jgi:biotin-dependent carboxylase-like uncharacterized protein
MTLEVLQPGLFSLVVDFGRPSSRSLGVPVGGAADRTALTLGNGLVGNAPDAAALEMSLVGPTLRAECDLAAIVFGAPFDLTSDRQALTANQTFVLAAGETLRIGGTATAARAYLCVRGGLHVPTILGSRSALGPIQAGDRLVCQPGKVPVRSLCLSPDEDYWSAVIGEPRTFHVLDGPQVDWFPRDSLDTATFTVTPASNRMGLRLAGPPFALPARELVSEPVCPGAVQVTRDGQCIVLGVDGQTIGGYPKLAQVISADLDRLGQLRPGDRLRLMRVSLETAETLGRERRRWLHEWAVRLRAADEGSPSQDQ